MSKIKTRPFDAPTLAQYFALGTVASDFYEIDVNRDL